MLLELNGKIGTLSIRENEVQMIAYVEFKDGSDDKKTYSKDDTEDYIINDLINYYGYKKIESPNQNNVNKSLKDSSLILLTPKIVLDDIEQYKEVWMTEDDWWFGSTTKYKNSANGYDVNVIYNEDTKKHEAIVYELEYDAANENSLQIKKDSFLKFIIDDITKISEKEIGTKSIKIDIDKLTVGIDDGSYEVAENLKAYMNVSNPDDYILSYNTKDKIVFHTKESLDKAIDLIDDKLISDNNTVEWADFDSNAIASSLMNILDSNSDKYFESLPDYAYDKIVVQNALDKKVTNVPKKTTDFLTKEEAMDLLFEGNNGEVNTHNYELIDRIYNEFEQQLNIYQFNQKDWDELAKEANQNEKNKHHIAQG